MKLRIAALVGLSLLLLNCKNKENDVPELKQPDECVPSNDETIMLPGIFYHEPVTECNGDILFDSFEDLANWDKRGTSPRELFENAAFIQDEVILNDNLQLNAGFSRVADGGCINEYGSQVTYKGRLFSPADEYTYSAIMKPAAEPGVVSAFFVHLIDKNTNNPDYCDNNQEIDIEVVKYGPDSDPSLRGKLICYFTSWTRALNPWGYNGNVCAADPAAWDQRKRESHAIQLDERFTDEFHKYSFTWRKDMIEFFIDDQLMATHTKVVPDKPAPLKINTWANNIWLGYSKESAFKTSTLIKEVCVSSN